MLDGPVPLYVLNVLMIVHISAQSIYSDILKIPILVYILKNVYLSSENKQHLSIIQ